MLSPRNSISVSFWIAIALDHMFLVVMNEVYLYTLYNLHTMYMYRIVGNFGGDFNLAIWQSGEKSPN